MSFKRGMEINTTTILIVHGNVAPKPVEITDRRMTTIPIPISLILLGSHLRWSLILN